MKLQRKGKRRKCRQCKRRMFTFQARYKATEGYYCLEHGRVKGLHDGVMKFIKRIVND